jgi:uncharacterized linocin/CFP29 family protein
MLLNKIPYGPGLNEQIFESLKATVNKLKAPNDRLCAVVFDELSIKPLLSCNKKTQCVEGVEDIMDIMTEHIKLQIMLTFFC